MKLNPCFEKKWNEAYNHLVQYCKIHGNSNVPTNYVCVDGFRLGRWVQLQRNDFKAGRIKQDRKESLEKLNFQFFFRTGSKNKETIPFKWNAAYDHLVHYLNTHDSSFVPYDYCSPEDGFRLGHWVRYQRRLYREGSLSPDQIECLKKIGFSFHSPLDHIYPYQEKKWNEAYNHLEQYYKKHGNSNVPDKYICDDGFRLGNWVHNQRCDYKAGRMSQDRKKLLSKIDFQFYFHTSLKHKQAIPFKWKAAYDHLVQYLNIHNSTLVPYDYCSPEDGFCLGHWVKYQRHLYHKGKMDPERIELLKKIDFIFDSPFDHTGNPSFWQNGYTHLTEYVTTFGNTLVPTDYKCPSDNYPLGTWVYNQRKDYKLNRLHRWRYEKLLELGFVFSVVAGARSPKKDTYYWSNGIKHLSDYVNTYGHALIRVDYKSPDGFSLGAWVKDLRNLAYKTLSISQIMELEALGFCFSRTKIYKYET